MANASLLKKQAQDISDRYSRQISSLARRAQERITGLSSRQNQRWGWLLAVALSFGVGLAAGILTAPNTGKETREKIGERAKNVTSMVGRREAQEEAKIIS